MIKTYIKRNLYLERIEPFIGKDLMKVIIGQRRVGKSYLLFQIMDQIQKKYKKKAPIIYINKELHEHENIQNHSDLIAHIKKKTVPGKKNYIFIDEIQDIQHFEKALRSLQAKGGYDIYITGSNANLLSGELATYLSGRYISFEVYSLSYKEFLLFHSLQESSETLFQYIRYGGLPYLINLKLDDQVAYEYLKNIYNTIIYKDVVSRFKIRNIHFLEKLIEYLADNVGSIVSGKRISDFLKSQKINIPPNVVLNYLSFLQSAFLIFRVPRSEIGGKKIFEINEKYYFEDMGLRHALIGYKQQDINKILENLVFMHLKIQGYKITVGQLPNGEIDFVCERAGQKIYIQVCYLISTEKVRAREFENLLKIQDNYRKIVVSMDEFAGGNEKGVEHMHIRGFLMLENL